MLSLHWCIHIHLWREELLFLLMQILQWTELPQSIERYILIFMCNCCILSEKFWNKRTCTSCVMNCDIILNADASAQIVHCVFRCHSLEVVHQIDMRKISFMHITNWNHCCQVAVSWGSRIGNQGSGIWDLDLRSLFHKRWNGDPALFLLSVPIELTTFLWLFIFIFFFHWSPIFQLAICSEY